MRTLKPQILKGVHYRDIEGQLRRIFYEIVFRPLGETMRRFTEQPLDARKTLLNAQEDALRDALRRGRIQYHDGVFSGEFSAAIGRDLRALGAAFDKRSGVYRMAVSRIPSWVKAEAAMFKTKAVEAHQVIAQKLDEILRDLDKATDAHVVDPHDTIESIEEDFNRLAKNIVVDPHLSPASRARISAEYSQNMKLWIKRFSQKTIVDLRGMVEKNAMEGYRFDKLVKGVKSRYGVTTSKAKFLARQETALFMANYRKERFMESGVTRYKWSTSHDARVRPAAGASPEHGDHRDLDGKICEYARPPIVATMPRIRRANPGEDYNCRCVDIPVLDDFKEAA